MDNRINPYFRGIADNRLTVLVAWQVTKWTVLVESGTAGTEPFATFTTLQCASQQNQTGLA